MTVRLTVDNVEVPIKVIKFSDGSSSVKLEVPEQLVKYPPNAYYSISIDPTTPADAYMWEIILTVSAIEETFGTGWGREILHLPYLPHARADRVFEKGNAFPLKMFFEVIAFMFNEILLTDPHSDYYELYTDDSCSPTFTVKNQHNCFIETVRDIESGSVLVSPDKGAAKKIYKLQQSLDNRVITTFVIEADKRREVSTGRIIETTLPKDFDYVGKIFYIVDDLFDYGNTFIPLAKKLRENGAKEVNLYVTHMIGAGGLSKFVGVIDNLYVYQTVGKYLNMTDILNFNNGKEVRVFD